MEFKHKCEVRFRDTDGLGHVNNAVYHSFLEQCRCHFFMDLGAFDPANGVKDLPLILARAEIDFLKPAFFSQKLVISTWVTKIGNKSLTMGYEVSELEDGCIVCRALAVLVWYDHKKDVSVEIPKNMKEKLGRYLR